MIRSARQAGLLTQFGLFPLNNQKRNRTISIDEAVAHNSSATTPEIAEVVRSHLEASHIKNDRIDDDDELDVIDDPDYQEVVPEEAVSSSSSSPHEQSASSSSSSSSSSPFAFSSPLSPSSIRKSHRQPSQPKRVSQSSSHFLEFMQEYEERRTAKAHRASLKAQKKGNAPAPAAPSALQK